MRTQQDAGLDKIRYAESDALHDAMREAEDDLDDRPELGSQEPTILELIDDVSNLELYLQEVRDIPLLSRDQEVSLAKQMEQGRQARVELEEVGSLDAERRDALTKLIKAGEEARQQLIEANSRLVISVAKRYTGRGLPLLDLIQEGYLGLIHAVDKFDYHRGYKLSTYATWWIRHTISRAVAEHGGTIRLPAHIGERIRQMSAVSDQLSQALGRPPSNEELASEMGLDPEQVALILQAQKRPLSFEEMAWDGEDSDTYKAVADENAVSPNDLISQMDLYDALDEVFSTLTPREARVLTLRYGLQGSHPHKLREIGKKFGLTRERIRQIEQEALAKLRQPHRRDVLAEYVA